MNEPNEQTNFEKRLHELEVRVRMSEAAGRSNVVMLKALIATHPDLQAVSDAFRHFSEGAVARSLGSKTSDLSIAAFEFFQDEWLQFLEPPAS
ncbi:hypothetical protein BX589_101254 [Paraburkholderia fungorum]|uniref:hypothetical protein n=1 Tax=Paraburkholderia fungorum TaxID=134537 RepID=UPI000D0629DA|nr:hypothetical protein [Paraburkholderia fungorum]PRZ56604.1 hypothetical protein BX589_101254 [Paraburkholderia fungorum]